MILHLHINALGAKVRLNILSRVSLNFKRTDMQTSLTLRVLIPKIIYVRFSRFTTHTRTQLIRRHTWTHFLYKIIFFHFWAEITTNDIFEAVTSGTFKVNCKDDCNDHYAYCNYLCEQNHIRNMSRMQANKQINTTFFKYRSYWSTTKEIIDKTKVLYSSILEELSHQKCTTYFNWRSRSNYSQRELTICFESIYQKKEAIYALITQIQHDIVRSIICLKIASTRC